MSQSDCSYNVATNVLSPYCHHIDTIVYENYYTNMFNLSREAMRINTLRMDCFIKSDAALVRMDLIGGLLDVVGTRDGDIDGVAMEEYKRILFIVIDMFSVLNSYAMLDASVMFRRAYLSHVVNAAEIRRELRVDYIFNELKMCYCTCRKIIDVFEYRFRNEMLKKKMCDMMFQMSLVGDSYVKLREVCNKVAARLFYKEFIMLRTLLLKFDYTVVECISKYYVDSNKYICFADIIRGGRGGGGGRGLDLDAT